MWTPILLGAYTVIEYVLKIIAIGTVPENRRPSSSQAWLLLILFIPIVGFPLYWLIGSPYVRGRRAEVQREADRAVARHEDAWPPLDPDTQIDGQLASIIEMNARLTGLPCVRGEYTGLYPDTAELFEEMAREIDSAADHVHLEMYIMARDPATEVVFAALERAAVRGVKVRVLLDHLGSRKYPGWREFRRRLTAAGIDWHLMMPVLPLRGRWRRPDLRNHRKMLVIDSARAFMGSHNLIHPNYDSAKNERIGRHWHDLSVRVGGPVVMQLEVVFATDWFAETGEQLDVEDTLTRVLASEEVDLEPDGVPDDNPMQLVPSGPGHPTEPNRHQFVALIHAATRRVTITSPYFVPDESLLTAISGAAYRGVEVELFVGESADQFLVGHAQRSYYRALLEAGVRIHLFPAPKILHSKYVTVDDRIAVIGSSNMDPRSFALDYEIMLLTFGGSLVADLVANDAEYRAISHELTPEEWESQGFLSRYVDNVCRLTSALM
jgi:cardiolipin synthase